MRKIRALITIKLIVEDFQKVNYDMYRMHKIKYNAVKKVNNPF
jgi:hypothetical protein